MSTSPSDGLWVEITCDGNRRCEADELSQELGRPVSTADLTPDRLYQSYKVGGDAMKRIIETARDSAVGLIAAWAWSTKNWERPQAHADAVFKVMNEFLLDLESDSINRPENADVRLVHMGQSERMVERVPQTSKLLHRICHDTRKRTGMVVALLLDYSGPDEEERALSRWDKRHQISGNIRQYRDCLDLPWQSVPYRELDLRIRTGETGRIKHTNAVMSGYAGLETRDVFHDIMLPHYTPELFLADLEEFHKTEKRQGK